MSRIMIEGARRSGRAGWLTILGVILVPLAIGGLLIAGLWKPVDRLQQVTAAVVNNDKPVEVNGQTVPLGRLLAGGLVTGGNADVAEGTVANVSASNTTTNFTWVLTDAADAAQGIQDGTYATVVTIPENFSAAATSYGGNDPAKAKQATVDIRTSDRSRLVDNAVAQTVTGTAVALLNEQLTTTYLQNIYVGFDQLARGVGDAATGAVSLADGVQKLATGTSGLAGGVGQLATGASGLADGVDQLSDGARDLSNGLGVFAEQTAEGAAAAAAGANGAQRFADGLGALASAGSQLGGGAAQSAEYAGDAASLTQTLAVQVGALLQECGAAPTPNCAQIYELAESFGLLGGAPGPDSLLYLTGAAAAASEGVSSGLNESQGGQPSFVDGLAQGAEGGKQLAAGVQASAAGLGLIAENLTSVAGGAGLLADGASRTASGAAQFADGAQAIADGAGQLATGAHSAATGADQLASGLRQAGDGIPRYTAREGEQLAAVVAAPVTAAGASSEDMFGPSSIPFFSALALWIGALATFLLLATVPHRALGSTRSPVLLAVQAAVPGMLIGVVQGLALGIPLSFLLGLPAGTGASFVAFSVLVAVVFALVNQGIVALFGGFGRFAAMVIATLGLAVSVVSTVPGIFDAVIGALPLSAAFTGGQMLISGAPGVGGTVAVLVVWGLAGLALTVIAVARRRVLSPRRAERLLPEFG